MGALGIDVLFRGQNLARLLGGLWAALRISLISVAISLPLGLLLGIAMTRENRLVRGILRCYLEFIRIMPQLVLLFLAYFGTTRAFGWDVSGEAASIAVFTLWGAAEMSDLTRGALSSIPRHQYESAAALGLTRRQVERSIILPQAVRRLILMIGVVEMLKVAQQIIEANRNTSPNAAFGVYLVVFILYFLACWPISCLARRLEQKWR